PQQSEHADPHQRRTPPTFFVGVGRAAPCVPVRLLVLKATGIRVQSEKIARVRIHRLILTQTKARRGHNPRNPDVYWPEIRCSVVEPSMSWQNHLRATFARVAHAPRMAARGLVWIYRYSFSALAGFHCRHLPTC